MKIKNTLTGVIQEIDTTEDNWTTNYKYQEQVVEIFFDNWGEEVKIIDKMLLDLINKPKGTLLMMLLYDSIMSEYIDSNKSVLFFEGFGRIKNTDSFKPITSYLDMFIKTR